MPNQNDQPAPSEPPSLDQAVGVTAGAKPAPDIRGTLLSLGDTTFVGTQRRIAFMLLWIMIGVIVIITLVSLGYSISCSRGSDCTVGNTALDMINKSLSPIFTAMIGLVGSVVGFYFGSKQTS